MSRPQDVNAPKRPSSAYFLFCKDNRDKLQRQHPDLKMIEITRKLCKDWKNIDDDLKQKYQDKADEAIHEYVKKLHEYKQSKQYQQYQMRLQKWENYREKRFKKKNIEI